MTTNSESNNSFLDTLSTIPINGKTDLYGVIGDPISHSASPAMHNAAYDELQLDASYLPLHVKPDQLKSAIDGLRALNFKGFNVTIPHKESIINLLDDVDETATQIGAVNTVVNENGRLVGYNTDGDGFILSLEKESNYDISNKSIVILGAGGSAKAIAFSLIKHNIKQLCILNRTFERALHLKQHLQKHTSTPISCFNYDKSDYFMMLDQSDLIINTTSLGMSPHSDQTPLRDMNWVKSSHFIYDIIYNPAETRFLSEAKKRGATIQNGAGMLAGQGCLGFNLFTKREINYTIMKDKI